MSPRVRHLLTISLLVLLPIQLAKSQAPLKKEVPCKSSRKHKAKKKLTWPRLSPAQKRLAKTKLKQLGNKNGEKVRAAKEILKALGPGVVPYAIKNISDMLPRKNESLFEITLFATQKAQVPLVESYLGHHLKSVRLLAIKLLVKLGQKRTIPPFKKRLNTEKEQELRELIAIGMCRLGSIDGLPILFEITKREFLDRRDEILNAVSTIKGEKATDWLTSRFRDKETSAKLAALRLIAIAGTKGAIKKIAPFLNDRNYTLKTEAINALRAIIDGKPPFKHISVFDMIRLRKFWQNRVSQTREG